MKVLSAIVSVLGGIQLVNALTAVHDGKEILPEQKKIEGASGEEASQFAWYFNPAAAGSPPLYYRGGPTMTGTIPLYVIFYGNNFYPGWSQSAYVPAVQNLLSGLSAGSSWYNVARQFANIGYPTYNNYNSVTTGYTYGQSINDGHVQAIIQQQINSGRFPNNSNAVYLVVGDSTVYQTMGNAAYGSHYCGYHSAYGNNLKYSYIGSNAPGCRNGPFGSPVGTLYASQGGDIDGVVSVILHEVTEAVTDPNLNAWFDNVGYENADECAYRFGMALDQPGRPNYIYNLQIGGYYYLVQQNYSQNSRSCPQVTYTS